MDTMCVIWNICNKSKWEEKMKVRPMCIHLTHKQRQSNKYPYCHSSVTNVFPLLITRHVPVKETASSITYVTWHTVRVKNQVFSHSYK